MNWTIVAGALATAGGLSALLWLAFDGGRSSAKAARTNLNRGLVSPSSLSISSRSGRRGGIVRVLANSEMLGYLDRLLLRAGRPAAWPVDRVLTVKLLAGLAGLALAGLMFVAVRTPQAITLGVVITLVAFFLPDLLLYNTGIKRRQAILLELPDTLDQMSIAVDAGLGFDSAMLRVARNGKGVLAGELIRTLQDLQVGQTRRVAYLGLAERCGVAPLRRFMRAVVQAEEYGIALADVLSTQAKEMRIERRQRAERKALELPVKLTFPLILFILPVLMIVILGPAVLSIMQVFGR
jgi:tight adherence protein C